MSSRAAQDGNEGTSACAVVSTRSRSPNVAPPVTISATVRSTSTPSVIATTCPNRGRSTSGASGQFRAMTAGQTVRARNAR